jgi:catechol 2,3-dioxygenase-like lactoylglutathione lyase family enzyme
VRLGYVCLITRDVPRLRDFYSMLLARDPATDRGDYVEFKVDGAAISMWSAARHEREAPGSVALGRDRAVMIELEVDDPDAEHTRLARAGVEIVKPPTTQEWGNRAVYVRDPDGNLVNLYRRVR